MRCHNAINGRISRTDCGGNSRLTGSPSRGLGGPEEYKRSTRSLVGGAWRRSTEHVLTGGGSSQSEKTKAQKKIDEISNAVEELSTWEQDVVPQLAEKRIELDLDDGVEVNYGKLGANLAKVKGLNA